MSRRLVSRERSRARAGFTLVEVMLATVIIGLGVLGLSALFAGAAKTQIDTTRLVRASQAIDRAAGSAGARFGGVSKGRWNTVTSFNTGQYAGGITVPGVRTVWNAFSAYDRNNNTGYPSHALTVDPSRDPTQSELEAFLLAPTPEVSIYEDPLAEFAGNVVRPVNYGSSGTLPSGDANQDFDTRLAPPANSPYWGGGPGPRIRNLPFARLEPGTLRVRFEIARQGPEATSLRVISRRVVTFSDGARADDVDDVNIADDDGNLQAVGSPDGLMGSDGVSWLMLDRGLDPTGGFQSSGTGEPTARIIAFNVRVHAQEWIERIVVERGERRVDRLLTLGERVSLNPDGTVSGVSALWRRGREGEHQLALAAYLAEPLTSGAPTPFIPPESGPNADRLWRRVRLTLDYDRGAGRFTLSTNQNDRTFALAAGQVLMVAGDGSNPSNAPNAPGAEAFVRVVRTVVGQGGRVTGYLDAPPRDRGHPMVWPSGLGTPSGFATSLPASAQVDVWALAPQVRSLSSDGRLWRIRPVEGRIVDVR